MNGCGEGQHPGEHVCMWMTLDMLCQRNMFENHPEGFNLEWLMEKRTVVLTFLFSSWACQVVIFTDSLRVRNNASKQNLSDH